MMVFDQAMQHKFSNTWKSSCETDYSSMAEDDLSANTKSITTKSMVNSILRHGDRYEERINGGSMKIQDIKSEKDSVDIKTCISSVDNDQDSPLDFSVKRRSSFSGSLSDDSRTSSSPGHATDYHASSSPTNNYHHHHLEKRETPSPEGDEQLNNMDHPHHLPSGISPLSMFSNLPLGLLDNTSVLNTISQAYLDPKNKKNSRPFKAYPKEALQMPLGFFGIPGLPQTSLPHGADSGLFAGLNSDELLKLYNQQVHMLSMREKSLQSSTSPNGKSSPHLQASSYNHSSNLSQSVPTSMSHNATSSSLPPVASSDLLRSSIMSTSPFPSPVASMNNATVVSSTSSSSLSHHSSSTTSRKRPRSLPDEQKDAAYWERRRKNNDAAKRSRDARRAKEDEIAIRAALLEQENLKLRMEVAALKTETARLRCLLCSS
uniref:BZIP domain-containing protein n=1 Tax=Biomphalaria glabrata TaxID=6526 RepID=A0A2C9JJ29_BIOGL